MVETERPSRAFRALQIGISSLFALIGVLALAGGATVAGACILGFAGLAFLLFEWRLRAHRRTMARVWSALEAIAGRDLDAPAPVQRRDPAEVIESSLVASRTKLLYVAGTWKGSEVELGVAVIAGRDADLVVQYACARDRSLPRPFRAMTRGAYATFARVGDKHPVATGDAAFDERWVVDADPALAHRVLDAKLRARLVDMQAQLRRFQVASIEATRAGLVVRFPGEPTPESAAQLRDLALEVHGTLEACSATSGAS